MLGQIFIHLTKLLAYMYMYQVLYAIILVICEAKLMFHPFNHPLMPNPFWGHRHVRCFLTYGKYSRDTILSWLILFWKRACNFPHRYPFTAGWTEVRVELSKCVTLPNDTMIMLWLCLTGFSRKNHPQGIFSLTKIFLHFQRIWFTHKPIYM